ncbi:MAG: DEAD/DEAH box helicase [Kofleriaceae bacterium]
MSKREAFSTGKPHQSAVAAWARGRLADQGGCAFDDLSGQAAPAQTGCLFADGVGLGKTWEALAAAALLLDKHAWRKRRRRETQASTLQRIHHRRREAHVLILVPPGLVAKWSRELRNPDRAGFPRRLKDWATRGSRGFVESTFAAENCFTIRTRTDLDSLPRGRIKRKTYTLPAGTYVCNWNVFLGPGGRGRDRVTALKNQRWDVVIADEAHHRRARVALDQFWYPSHTLLLTATPFQLDMTELHGLTAHLIEGKAAAHKVLKRGVVRDYARAADRAFEGGDAPTAAERRDAEVVLGQLVACSKLGRQKRHYFAISGNGQATPIRAPTDLEADDLSAIFKAGIQPASGFSEWYLEQRLKLARREAGDTPKHVAIELRKLLSVNEPPAPLGPRLEALKLWARTQFRADLEHTLIDGLPRKLLVFTHLKTNVAKPIMQALCHELEAAYRDVARSPRGKLAHKAAPSALADVIIAVKQHVSADKLHKRLDMFAHAIRGTPFFDLFGIKAFANNARRQLMRIVGADELRARSNVEHMGNDAAWYETQQRAKESAAIALLDAVASAPLAATFTGDDTRRARDSIAEAFKTALAPWILVATNVGSEGIDLHTYSRHLVHFDLEWNPARMEQREGRIDRLGRALKEPARIYYLPVKDTYDERMFHQLVARQRWHGVLLGRKALQLGTAEAPIAKLLSAREATTMSLDLDPRRRGATGRRQR